MFWGPRGRAIARGNEDREEGGTDRGSHLERRSHAKGTRSKRALLETVCKDKESAVKVPGIVCQNCVCILNKDAFVCICNFSTVGEVN